MSCRGAEMSLGAADTSVRATSPQAEAYSTEPSKCPLTDRH